jgi:hypothetical protein
MSGLRVEIERLQITVETLPATEVEEAMAGLNQELEARLARARWMGVPDSGRDIGSIVSDAGPARDAAALRAVIVARLVEIILAAAAEENR